MATLLFVVLGAFAAITYFVSHIGSRGRNLPPGMSEPYQLFLPPKLIYLRTTNYPSPRKHPPNANAPCIFEVIPPHFRIFCASTNLHRFTEWAKIYGGMYSLKIGTGTMIVLTDRRLVKQLIDKKSSIYSKRPPSYLGQLITGGDHLLIMDYSNKWRALRKIIHQHFMESIVVKEHTKIVDAEAVQMCRDFLIAPRDHMLHPRRFSNSVAMSLRTSFLADICRANRCSLWCEDSLHGYPTYAQTGCPLRQFFPSHGGRKCSSCRPYPRP